MADESQADGSRKRSAASEADSDSDSDMDDKLGESGGKTDELSRLRREKRLAMNRESARARRKRKKVLLETLEQQVADLAKRNQRYQVANESLTAKVHQLETDLAMARQTIAMLTNQNAGGSAGQPGGVNAALASRDFSQQDAIRRFLQAQSQGGAGRGLQGLTEESLLRQNALDFHALSQASRESAMASVLGRMGPGGTGAPSAPAGLHPPAIQNTLAMPSEMGLEGGHRLSEGYSRLQGLQLDALAPSGSHQSATSSQVINELLKQRAAKYGSSPK